MKKAVEAYSLELYLICYPYYPSLDTGRGHDRYVFELKQNIENGCPDIHLSSLDQGFSKGALAAGTKLFRLIADVIRAKKGIFHAISPVGGATAVMLGKSPLIVTIHDLIHFNVSGYDYSWKYWLFRKCIKLTVKKSDAVIVPYMVTKDEIVSRFNVPASKIHVVNYGVDHQTFYPRPAINRSARQVLYIGEVSRSKGVDALIRAFAVVRKSISDAELLIGGKSSKDQPLLENLNREMDLQGVNFLGYIPEDELPRYYSSAAVMVFPSRCGFGLSTLEAMACGTPVIVGNALDAPEFVASAGILINPDDIAEMANSIIRVLKEPDFKEQLSAKAIERAKVFSWERTTKETVDVYRTVMQGRAGGLQY